jgi:hypothetical protein
MGFNSGLKGLSIMYILSSVLKIQLWVSDLYSDSAPELSVPNKCYFLKTMILHLSLISPGPQSVGVKFQIQQENLAPLNSEIWPISTKARITSATC